MEGQIGVLAKAVAGTRQQIQESKRVTDQFERRQTYSVATKGLRDTLLNEEQQKKWEHPKGKPLTPPAGKPQQKAKPT